MDLTKIHPTLAKEGQPIKGRFIFKQEWTSLCSRHKIHDFNCELCQCGFWRYVIINRLEIKLFRISPTVWRLFRKIFSRQ